MTTTLPGGAVFDDTAEFIGHENTAVNLAAEEGNEVFAEVRAPDTTYSDSTSVTLGGKTVEMIHAMPSHSNDSSIIRFPDERAVFAVDFVNVQRVPFQTMSGWGPVTSWIEAQPTSPVHGGTTTSWPRVTARSEPRPTSTTRPVTWRSYWQP